MILLLNTVQASVSISEPKGTYNLGDSLDTEIVFSYSEQIHGFLRITLACGGGENLVYFSPTIIESSHKSVDISYPVSKALGSCHISASIEDEKNNKLEEEKTINFLLTDKIDIDASINKEEFEPSDTLEIEGEAIKANGEKVNGIIEILIDDNEYTTSVSKGKFSYGLELAENILPGPHNIILKIEDIKGNKGNNSVIFKIKQIPTSLTVETNNNEFILDEILIITPKLFDQAQQVMSENINVRLLSKETVILFLSKDRVLLEESVQSSNETMYRFTEDAPPGEYIVEASFDNLKIEKTILVLEFEKVEFKMENNTLAVTNIGNVPYKKSIEVMFKIQEQVIRESIDLDLEVGETQVFELEAPKGTYDLDINAGEDSMKFSNVPLTGNVVATIDLNPEKNIVNNWALWLFIAIVIILVIFLYFKNKKKRKYGIKKKETERIDTKAIEREHRMISAGAVDKDIKKIFNKHTGKLAAQTIMPSLVYGTKQQISVLLISISGFEKFAVLKKKDLQKFNKVLDRYFEAITQKIKVHQGVVDLYGSNLVVFFNVVKQYRHDIAAIKTAKDIRKITEVFNEAVKNLDVELRVKAGINTGLATVSSIGADKAVKYTSIGNTITLAKALKNKALENEILIPEKIYEHVSNVINAKRIMPLYLTGTKAINIYSVKDNGDVKERHRWYVDRALRR